MSTGAPVVDRALSRGYWGSIEGLVLPFASTWDSHHRLIGEDCGGPRATLPPLGPFLCLGIVWALLADLTAQTRIAAKFWPYKSGFGNCVGPLFGWRSRNKAKRPVLGTQRYRWHCLQQILQKWPKSMPGRNYRGSIPCQGQPVAKHWNAIAAVPNNAEHCCANKVGSGGQWCLK